VEKHIDGDKHEGGKSVEGYWELSVVSVETRIEKREVRKMKREKKKKELRWREKSAMGQGR